MRGRAPHVRDERPSWLICAQEIQTVRELQVELRLSTGEQRIDEVLPAFSLYNHRALVPHSADRALDDAHVARIQSVDRGAIQAGRGVEDGHVIGQLTGKFCLVEVRSGGREHAKTLTGDFPSVTVRAVQNCPTPPFRQAGNRRQFIAQPRRDDDDTGEILAATCVGDPHRVARIFDPSHRRLLNFHSVRRRFRAATRDEFRRVDAVMAEHRLHVRSEAIAR